MPTFIKTGFWDKKAKAPDGWLDLNLFVETITPSIYSSDGILTGNRLVDGNDNMLSFFNIDVLTFNAADINLQVLSERIRIVPNTIRLERIGSNSGLTLNFQTKTYQLGQLTGGNQTRLTISDTSTFPVQVSGTNVSQNTSGTASGKFLKIKVDGVDYVIELKNPS